MCIRDRYICDRTVLKVFEIISTRETVSVETRSSDDAGSHREGGDEDEQTPPESAGGLNTVADERKEDGEPGETSVSGTIPTEDEDLPGR